MKSPFYIYFDDKDVLHIAPKDGVAAMALKYFEKERAAHGEIMIVIDTDIPLALPPPATR